MKYKIWIGILVFIMVSVGLWVFRNRNYQTQTQNDDFVEYVNNKIGYKMLIPNGWNIFESSESGIFLSRVAFRPSDKSKSIGNMGEISVTVVATSSGNYAFSTKKEFDEWYGKPDEKASGEGIFKFKNETISGFPALRIAEVSKIENKNTNFWSSTSWAIVDGKNFYINMMGNGVGDFSEDKIFSWLVSKFEVLPKN